MGQIEVEAIVATTHPLEVYGGVQLADSAIEQLAEHLRGGQVPMLTNHDVRRPMSAEVLAVELRPTEDGHRALWVRFLVDEDDWRRYDEQRIAAGAPGGFSYAASVPFAEFVPTDPTIAAETLDLDADAAYWDEDDLLRAGEALVPLGTVHVGSRYQFAVDPLPVVALTVAGSLVTSVAANLITDALKEFLGKHPGKTTFHFHVKHEGAEIVGRLDTSDPQMLGSAVRGLGKLAPANSALEWEEGVGWVPAGGEGGDAV